MSNEKRIILLDPSSLEKADCPRKLQLSNRIGLVPKMGSDALDFGQALHRAAADFRTDLHLHHKPDMKKSIDLAVAYYEKCLCAKEHPRSVDDLRNSCLVYLSWIIENSDSFQPLVTPDQKKIAVEIPFKIPLYSNADTDVLLSGVVDAAGIFTALRSKPRMSLLDTKTSASFDIKKHLQEQMQRPQFHVYSYAFQQLGYHDPARPGKRLPIVIEGVYIGGDNVKVVRSDAYDIPDYMVDRTMDYARFIARQMAHSKEDESWPCNYNVCQGRYRMCEFSPICSVSDKDQHVPQKICFNTRHYDPLKFGE